MMDFVAACQEDEPVEAPPAELVAKESPGRLARVDPRSRELERIEAEVLLQSFDVVSAMMRFAEVDPETTEPPDHWVAEYGEVRAHKMLKVARLSYLPGKTAPVAIVQAPKVMQAIVAARRGREDRKAVLNVALVQLGAPTFNYETVQVQE